MILSTRSVKIFMRAVRTVKYVRSGSSSKPKVEIMPALKHNSLISAAKFADADYVYVTELTPEEVLI